MKTGVIGDIHGRIFHALLLITRCQEERSEKYDLILQAGDVGVWPDPEQLKAMLQQRRLWAEEHGLNPDAIERLYSDLVNHFIEEEMKRWRGRLVKKGSCDGKNTSDD